MLYFIVNPVSGSGYGKKALEKIKSVLIDKNLEFKIFETQYVGHATKLSKELSEIENCEVIAAVGGDGTFCEVLNGMNLSVPLCLIPTGTGNDFARSIGIDFDTALQSIFDKSESLVDYITVNGRRCLNVAGTGFDIQLLLNERKIRRFIKGKTSYYLALVKTIFSFKFHNAKVIIDDEHVIETPIFMIAVANGKYIGGGMPISLNSIPNDGIMDIIIIKQMPRIEIPKMLIKFLQGKLYEEKKYVEIYHGEKLKCFLEPPTYMNLDGEILDILPVEIELKKGGVKLCANCLKKEDLYEQDIESIYA